MGRQSQSAWVRYPLAVRSSSLLEDSQHQPFAGVYATKMIPNNEPERDRRFARLTAAIAVRFRRRVSRADELRGK